MKRFVAVLIFALIASRNVDAQSATPGAEKKKPVTEKKQENSAAEKMLGGTNTNSDEPIVTEIYADEAMFDSAKNMGIFSGHVKITDPRFNLQSDKLTVYLTKGEDQGLQKAIADGNVGVVRDRPDPNGGPPTRSIGRSDHAVYTASDGNVEMTGTPRVQQGINMHVATSADTVMILNPKGQLTTRGPSRTEIHQEAKKDKPDKAEAKKE